MPRVFAKTYRYGLLKIIEILLTLILFLFLNELVQILSLIINIVLGALV